MFPTFISILDIQSWWEVPSIAHFCSLFRTSFNLLDFDIEDLEEALLTDGTEEPSWLQELIVELLKGCLPNNAISVFNYQMFLRRLFRHKCLEHNIVNPFNTDIDFQLLQLRVKVDILHALCDFRLEADDVIDQLKNLEADSLRVQPLGYDANDSAYWYFYGTRLYREDNPKGDNPIWQVICFTLNDWEQLVEKLKKSAKQTEQRLSQTLQDNFIPELPRLFKEKECWARKRLLESLPRRASNRLKLKSEEDEKCKKLIPEEEGKISGEEEVANKLQYKKREELSKKREFVASDSESQGEGLEIRYEMAGHKIRDKKSKGSKHSKEEDGGRSNRSGSTKGLDKKQSDAKPVGRQTNNSLASATGQILIQQVSNPHTHRKKLKPSQVFSQTDEDLETGLHKILNHVKNHDDAWPFIEPVEEEYAPNYYSIIRKPMDLQRMEERLDSGHYKSFSKFKTDFQLIVNNCRLYNGIDNEYTEMVDNLVEVFDRAVERYLDQISSSDEEIAVEYPDADKDKNQKRKRSDSISSAPPLKRKPTLVAQTDRKKERSPSEESMPYQSDEDVKPHKKGIKKEDMVKNSKKDKYKSNKKDKDKISSKKEDNYKKIKDEGKKNKLDKIKGKKLKNDSEDESKISSEEEDDIKLRKPKIKREKYVADEKEVTTKKHKIEARNKINEIDNSKSKRYKNFVDDQNGKHKKIDKKLKDVSKVVKDVLEKKPKDHVDKKLKESSDKKQKEVINKKEKEVPEKKHKEKKELSLKKTKKFFSDEEDEKVSKKHKELKSKKDDKKHHKSEDKVKKHETKKQHKSALQDKKKPGRKPKTWSPSPQRKSRSPSKDAWSRCSSPPPSWPPSSPEMSPHKTSKSKHCFSDEEQIDDNKGKHKQKNDKWKEIFKEEDPLKKKETTPTPPKHKDKHNKLRETIEKLKAKSDLSKLKDKELKVYDFESERSKENQDISKIPEKCKNADVKKKAKVMKKDDYEDENSTADSLKSQSKGKSSKKGVNSAKGAAAIEALSLATEQTLKDINKWLDDTPRFSEFSSGSNSPSHFSGIDDFDNLSGKIEDKKKALLDKPVMLKKDPIKDLKKRPFQRDPTKLFRRREVQRTIDRLQPGKSKGNLISNVQSTTKPDELFPLGPLSKIKDTKNSLIVKTDESAPKLSLGSVLDSFGKHKFVDDELKKEEVTKVEKEEKEPKVETDGEKEVPKKEETIVEPPKLDNSPGQATPNLSAWFKAFGAPKVQPAVAVIKKPDIKDEKIESELKKEESANIKKVPLPEPSPSLESPLMQGQPAPRQRKVSTGSSMSERSSFSQDMDSPRVGIDERLGAYPAPYPSPLHKSPSGASPNLRSPLPDVSPKSTPYPFNGQIRVGFYQDTVSTKSSPDKSCSPRDNPQSPYPQYSEHVYTPATTQNAYSYNSPYYTQPPNYSSSNPTPPYNHEQSNPPSFYDTNKPLTDQYQAKNSATSPVNITTANSPIAPQVPSPSVNQQVPSAVEDFKPTQLTPAMDMYNQHQHSPAIDTYNQQSSPTVEPYSEPPKYQTQVSPALDKYRQHTQEEYNKLNIQSQNTEIYNQQLPTSVESYRPQAAPNIEPYRQQQQPASIETFRPEMQVREKPVQPQQSAATFPVKKRAYSEIDQVNRFEEQYSRPNLEMGLLANRMPTEQTTSRDPPKYVHQNIPEPRPINPQQTQNPQSNPQEPNPLSIRNVNFPAPPNPYNYNESYPINIPTRGLDSDRKVDMSKYTNMGYTGPEINFARNPTQYNKPEINYPKPGVTTNVSTEQTSAQRFADNNVMNMSGYKAAQTSNSSDSTTNIVNNRLENVIPRLDNYKSEVTIPRPTYSSSSTLEMDSQLALRGNLANLTHIVDRFQNEDRMLSGLQTSAQSYFSDKNMPSQPMFSKPLATTSSGLPMFSQPNTMPYTHNIQATSSMYNRPMSELQNSTIINQDRISLQQQMQEKKSKRKKTSKTVTPPTSAMESPVTSAPAPQGFQSYTGLKNPASMEPSAISLKTASVVPGSAFNFGPTATGLGLGTGLYGDKDAYPNFLEDFRSPPNYYMAAAAAAHHRSTPEGTEKAPARAAHQNANPQAPSYAFIGAPQPRPPSYPLGAPFIPPHQGGLMDASSPLYQQYLQAGVLHQGLLGPPGAYPPGYHPLSMRQPYETMTRPSWL